MTSRLFGAVERVVAGVDVFAFFLVVVRFAGLVVLFEGLVVLADAASAGGSTTASVNAEARASAASIPTKRVLMIGCAFHQVGESADVRPLGALRLPKRFGLG